MRQERPRKRSNHEFSVSDEAELQLSQDMSKNPPFTTNERNKSPANRDPKNSRSKSPASNRGDGKLKSSKSASSVRRDASAKRLETSPRFYQDEDENSRDRDAKESGYVNSKAAKAVELAGTTITDDL